MSQKLKEALEEAEAQAEKIALFMRAKMGLPLHDEERGILIQPNRIEERTRVKMQQVIIHTYLRTLYEVTGFDIYKFIADEFDHYLISLDGMSRTEYIQDRQPKVVQPMPSATTVNVGEKEEKREKK